MGFNSAFEALNYWITKSKFAYLKTQTRLPNAPLS